MICPVITLPVLKLSPPFVETVLPRDPAGVSEARYEKRV